MTRYTVHTAKSQGYRGSVPSHSQYGYVVRITPPIVTMQEGQDIEGIGFVKHRLGPRRLEQHFLGWYRYKADAVKRASEYAKGD